MSLPHVGSWLWNKHKSRVFVLACHVVLRATGLLSQQPRLIHQQIATVLKRMWLDAFVSTRVCFNDYKEQLRFIPNLFWMVNFLTREETPSTGNENSWVTLNRCQIVAHSSQSSGTSHAPYVEDAAFSRISFPGSTQGGKVPISLVNG